MSDWLNCTLVRSSRFSPFQTRDVCALFGGKWKKLTERSPRGALNLTLHSGGGNCPWKSSWGSFSPETGQDSFTLIGSSLEG